MYNKRMKSTGDGRCSIDTEKSEAHYSGVALQNYGDRKNESLKIIWCCLPLLVRTTSSCACISANGLVRTTRA